VGEIFTEYFTVHSVVFIRDWYVPEMENECKCFIGMEICKFY